MRKDCIGWAVRLVRAWRKMSQTQLAVRAELTQGLISRMERGKHTPEPANFTKIVKALGVTEEEISDLAWELETGIWHP